MVEKFIIFIVSWYGMRYILPKIKEVEKRFFEKKISLFIHKKTIFRNFICFLVDNKQSF